MPKPRSDAAISSFLIITYEFRMKLLEQNQQFRMVFSRGRTELHRERSHRTGQPGQSTDAAAARRMEFECSVLALRKNGEQIQYGLQAFGADRVDFHHQGRAARKFK